MDELFIVVGGDVMEPSELAVGLGERLVWVSGRGRYGVFEMEE